MAISIFAGDEIGKSSVADLRQASIILFLREFHFPDSTLCSIPRIYTGTKIRFRACV